MSKKTNVGKKPVKKDYGIQPYRICDKEYSDVMRTPTFKAAKDAVVVRESEYAKPYDDEHEDYSGMEYAAPNWPWIDYPGIDYPWMELPVPDFPEMYDPYHIRFFCSTDPCWCEGEEKTFAVNCSHEIIDVGFNPAETDLSVEFTKSTVSITAVSGIRWGESGWLDIHMRAKVKGRYVYGSHTSILVSECWSSKCCQDDTGIAWDWDNSDEVIERPPGTSTAALAITDSGSGGPYNWDVTGTGFTLDSAKTEGLTNTLNADATACGSATITVTGCGGTSVEGTVRCTSSGSWNLQGTCCPCCGACQGFGAGDCDEEACAEVEEIQGQGKWIKAANCYVTGWGSLYQSGCAGCALCTHPQPPNGSSPHVCFDYYLWEC